MRHVRAEEAFASTEEAERATSASADTPSGRLEWVTTRALNKQYESTDELVVDVKRTWGVSAVWAACAVLAVFAARAV